MKLKACPHVQCDKTSQNWELNRCVAIKKPLVSETYEVVRLFVQGLAKKLNKKKVMQLRMEVNVVSLF